MSDLPDQLAEALVVHPGDTLIVRLHRDTPQQALVDFKDAMSGRLPDVQVLVVNAEQILAYRPDRQAT